MYQITRSEENIRMIVLVDNKKTFDRIHFLYFLEILNKLEIGKYLHFVIKISLK